MTILLLAIAIAAAPDAGSPDLEGRVAALEERVATLEHELAHLSNIVGELGTWRLAVGRCVSCDDDRLALCDPGPEWQCAPIDASVLIGPPMGGVEHDSD